MVRNIETTWKNFVTVPNHLWELFHIIRGTPFHIDKYDYTEITTALHTHNFIQIYYVYCGIVKHTVMDISGKTKTEAILTAGDIFILPPWFYHQLTPLTKDIRYISICFCPKFIHYNFRRHSYFCNFISHLLSENIGDNGMCPKSCISLKTEQGEVSTLLHSLFNEYSLKRDGYLTYIKGDLLKLLVIIARHFKEAQQLECDTDTLVMYNEPIKNSIRYVNENFREDLRLDEVARRFLISRTYFCKLFKHITGYTFNEYIANLRLNNAKNLIISTNDCISHIALLSGFNDISNFCRRFKKKYGMSPSMLRKTYGTY